MIVHVSGREAMEQIRWAQQRGLKVYAETCPQYITLTAEDLKGLDMDDERRQVRLLAAAARRGQPGGDLGGADAAACSRPSPRTIARSATTVRRARQAPKGSTSFRWVPNGIPGIETRLPILFSEGVSKGRISLQRFVELTATNHAKLYGLYPQKGSIGVGFDADITLWDPNRRETIAQANLHHGADYTPWEGFAVTGWPVMTIARGKVVAEDGKVVGAPGGGRVLQRQISPYAA